MHKIDKLTEKETKEFIATITDIKITNTGKNFSAEIYTKEYDSFLYVSNSVCNRIGIDTINALKAEERIFFRVENINSTQINKVDFINVVSLRTDKKSIFTLEEYNEFMHISAKPARIASVVVLGVCFVLFLKFLTKRNFNQGTVL